MGSKQTSEIPERTANPTESKGPETDTSDNTPSITSPPSLANTAPLQDNIDDLIQSIFTIPGLSEHRYISLTEFSVFRAYVQNASLLAISLQILADDDALSPWTTSNPYPALAPFDICPTSLQLSTAHHPYIDIIAPPSLRDNVILSALTQEQEDQLCYDMHVDSFTIWGSQPWNAPCMYISPPSNETMIDRWPCSLGDIATISDELDLVGRS